MLEKGPEIVMHQPNAKFQFLAASVVNLLTLSYGITCGWPSPNILILTSDETPLPSGKITIDEASWIASLTCLGSIVGNIVFGYLTGKFGRKNPLIFLTIPTVISWLLIWFAQNVFHLYASRFLNGIVGGAIFVITPAYLSEIATDRVRGVLGSTLSLSCTTGFLVAFTFGHIFDFYTTPKFVIMLMIAFGFLLFFFPESPSFLVTQNRLSEAEKSIRFYQNLSGKDKDYELLQTELNRLRSFIESEKSGKSDDSFKWSDLTTNPGRNAILLGLFLVLLNQFCGCFAMLNYTATIFEEAGSSMSPNVSAIIVGIIQLLGSCVAANLVDRAGRKFLFVVSSLGIALGLISLGVYMMLKSWGIEVDSFNWVPIASFSFVIFISCWAVLSLPFLVISEVMPEKLKNFGSTLCMIVLSTLAFFVVKYLPLLTATLEFHGTMFLFAGYCLLSTVFIILYMPETKGKSYDEIMNLLQ